MTLFLYAYFLIRECMQNVKWTAIAPSHILLID